MSEEEKTSKPTPSAEVLEVRQKAKEAAKAEGKDWATLSKEERQAFKKSVRGPVKKEAKRIARQAEKAAAASK